MTARTLPLQKEKISDGMKLSGDHKLEPKLLFGVTVGTMCTTRLIPCRELGVQVGC